jgi:HTH-type transcriptional regulator/antitoxin HigA
MIYNERQYKITGKEIENLNASLEALHNSDQPDWLKAAQIAALKSQVSELEAQLVEYELVKEGRVQFTECSDLTLLPKILVQSRIARGLSQKELGEALNLTAQQIQRYEASDYMGASLSRLIDIAEVLGVTLKEAWGGEKGSEGAVFVWNDPETVNWDAFPLKDMTKRGWLDFKHGQTPSQAIQSYFSEAAGKQYATALHRKKFHGANRPNEYSLLAWQARVLELARNEVSSGKIGEYEDRDDWLSSLVALSVSDEGPLLAKSFLAERGIVLVVEEHLPGTYLDGAAMLLDNGTPVIGLTLRYDRLDNFWFVLFHELGHVILHLFDSLEMDFFDEEGGDNMDIIEREADEFALDQLIPLDNWNQCVSRFSVSEESVLIDAENLNIHPAIIAGRIRKESNNFMVLNDLVGQGTVRKLLGGCDGD